MLRPGLRGADGEESQASEPYRFADHKERVIDLLARVTTVSVETMRVLAEMPGETV